MIQNSKFSFLIFLLISFISLYFTSEVYSRSVRSNDGKFYYTKSAEVKYENYAEFVRIRGERVLAYKNNDAATLINTVGNKTFIQIIEEEIDICFVRIPDIDLGYYEGWIKKAYIKKKKNNHLAKYYGKPLILIEDLIEQDNAWVFSDSTFSFSLPNDESTTKFTLQFGREVYIQKESNGFYDIKVFSESKQDYISGWIKKSDITKDERVLSGELLDSSEILNDENNLSNEEQLKILEERKNKLLLVKEKQNNKALEDLSKSSNNNELQYYLTQFIENKKKMNHLAIKISNLSDNLNFEKDEVEQFEKTIIQKNAIILMSQNFIDKVNTNKTEIENIENKRLEQEEAKKENVTNYLQEININKFKSNSLSNEINLSNKSLSKNLNIIDSLYNVIISNNDIISSIRKTVQSISNSKGKLSSLSLSLETINRKSKNNSEKINSFDKIFKTQTQEDSKLKLTLEKKQSILNNLIDQLNDLRIKYENYKNERHKKNKANLLGNLKIEKNNLIKVIKSIDKLKIQSNELNRDHEQFLEKIKSNKFNITNTEEIIIKLRQDQIKFDEKQTKIIAEKEKFKQIRNHFKEIERFSLILAKHNKKIDELENDLVLDENVIITSEDQKTSKEQQLEVLNQTISKLTNSKRESKIAYEKDKADRGEQIEIYNSDINNLKIRLKEIDLSLNIINKNSNNDISDLSFLTKNLTNKNKAEGELIKEKNTLENNKILNEQNLINSIYSFENKLEKLKRDYNRKGTHTSKLKIDLEDYFSKLNLDSLSLIKANKKKSVLNDKITLLLNKSRNIETKEKENKSLLSQYDESINNLIEKLKLNSEEYSLYKKYHADYNDSMRIYNLANIDKNSEVVLIKMQLKFLLAKKISYDKKHGEIDKQLAELEKAQKNLKSTSKSNKSSEKKEKPRLKNNKKSLAKSEIKKSESQNNIEGNNRNNYNLNLLIRSKTTTIKNIIKHGKKKDSELKGDITLKFTLLPSGTTKNVRIVKSTWSNKKVGKYINRLIEKKVRKWVFPEDNNPDKSKIKPKKVVKIYHF